MECSFDDNKHESVITKKLQEIPYHTVNHWNEAITLFYNVSLLALDNVHRSVRWFCVLCRHKGSMSKRASNFWRGHASCKVICATCVKKPRHIWCTEFMNGLLMFCSKLEQTNHRNGECITLL